MPDEHAVVGVADRMKVAPSTPARVEIAATWATLHGNRPDGTRGRLGALVSIGLDTTLSRAVRVGALCAASATARAVAGCPKEIAVSLGHAASVAAGGDADLIAMAAFRWAHGELAAGDPERASVVASVGREVLRDAKSTVSRIYGGLLLVEAVGVFRAGGGAWERLLDEAAALAEMLNADAADPGHTEFCAANVAAHRIHLLVADGRPDEAQAVYERSDFSALSEERQQAVRADLAQGTMSEGEQDETAESVVQRITAETAAAILDGAFLWQATDVVEAWRLTKGTHWYNQNGSSAVAEAGDWICNDGRAIWSVRADVFADTYEEVGDCLYKKRLPVRAVQLYQDAVVETLEGDMVAKAGDWLVANGSGERWPVQGWIFAERYERVEEETV